MNAFNKYRRMLVLFLKNTTFSHTNPKRAFHDYGFLICLQVEADIIEHNDLLSAARALLRAALFRAAMFRAALFRAALFRAALIRGALIRAALRSAEGG